MNPEISHDEIIERLTTSFVVPFFQPAKGLHANWEAQSISYRIDQAYSADQHAAAVESFELWDDLIALDLSETTGEENIYFEKFATLGTLAKHVDLALWIAGGAVAVASGLTALGMVATPAAPIMLAGAAYISTAELAAAIVLAYEAANGFDGIASMVIELPGAFSPIKTNEFDFDGDDQVRIDWASVHFGYNDPVLQIGFFDLSSPGLVGFEAFVHEIGHALGLSHPGLYNGGLPDRNDPEVYLQDSVRFSIMSYFFDERIDGLGADWRGFRPSTPMLHDILAIQDKYGADTRTRTGDTVYGFNSTAGRSVFDFNVNASPVVTIYDAGGIDTLDASGYSQDQFITLGVNKVGQSLNDEKFSSIGQLQKNVAIAYGVVIENAIGGSGRDVVSGNEADNRLSGMADRDTLQGWNGNDTLDGGLGADSMEGGERVTTSTSSIKMATSSPSFQTTASTRCAPRRPPTCLAPGSRT